MLYSDIVPLCKLNYLYGDLPFFKIQVNPFRAQDKQFGAKIIPKYILWARGLVPFWVLRHSFLSLTGCLWLYNIQLKTSRGILFLSPSDAYVRSFLYLLYTLINFVTQKLLAIKPRLWPRIKFFSWGQESRHCNSITTCQWQGLGAQLWFQRHLYIGTTHRHVLWRCP